MTKRKLSTLLSLLFGVFAFVLLGLTSLRPTKSIETHASEVVYETPDYISVSDLKQNGVSVGNKIILDAQKKYKYDRTTEYGSLVFTFTFKNNPWKVDSDGVQFHFYDGWQMHGAFWLRPDKLRIIHDPTPGTNDHPSYAVFDAISEGEHKIELGRLAIMNGDTYSGNQYYYIKVDDNLWGEYTINNMDNKFIEGNTIFSTGTAGNALLDVNWQGSKVTYIANGEVFKEENSIDEYLTKPATDPVCDGKTFVGWFDEMGREWDFAKNPARDNLVLRAGFKSNETGISDEEYFNDNSYTPVLRFMVASDVHIGTSESRRDTNLANSIDYSYTFAQANNKYNKLDAALFAGDITDSGDMTQLTHFKNTATAHLKGDTQLIASMGNHDYRSASPAESISNFESLFGVADKHLVINGYHFITLSPDIERGEHFSQSKVEWLDAQLAIAAEADPTKPIFLMQHEHIQGTVYGSDAWYVSELTDVVCKYPQIVDFSGHSHYPLADPRSIWQGTFTAFGTGTLHYYEVGINGYKNTGIFPYDKTGGWHTGASEESKAAEYLIVEIDANNAIRVIAYDLMSNSEITRYYIRNAMDDVKFKYSHTERAKDSQKPVFGQNATLSLTPVYSRVDIEFDQATCEDVVESYRIEVYKNSQLIRTEYVLSDYFYNPTPEKLSYQLKGVNSDTEYTFKVYAVNVWNDVCDVPLTGTVRTNEFEIGEEAYAEYDTLNLLDIEYPNNNGIFENMQEKEYNYPGHATNITAKTTFYLITGDLTSEDEFRVTIGKIWDCYNAFWIQKDHLDVVFLGWKYSTRPIDRHRFNIESNKIYKIEFGTLFVEEGEHMGEAYTFLKINDQNVIKVNGELVEGFYFPRSEYLNTQHTVSLKVTSNYKMADYSLGRNIEYYVDGNKYAEDFGINGLQIKAPANPTSENLYFVGWYTQPEGGERVNFANPINFADQNVKLYARFTDSTYNLKVYSEDQLIDTQLVGKDCVADVPSDPVKTGQYSYTFVKWVIRGTDQEFDFNTRFTSDVEIEAVFEETKYRIVYLVDGVEYETKYYVESNPSVIIGDEPAVPTLVGATGHWQYADWLFEENNNKHNIDIYARAIYDGTSTTASNEITLNKFDGETVDIADELTRYYLSFADTNQQATWLENYPVSGGHERQDIEFSWSDTERNTSYLVYFADNAQFENAFIVKTDKKNIDYVGIFEPGKTYYWKVIGLTTNKCSAVDTFTILNSPVRWLSTDTVFNVRDLGGWTTTNGKVVNYGLIYRGAQLSLDQQFEASYMSDYSFKVFDYLRLKTEIELRGDKPHELNQFNEFENLININGANYEGLFKLNDATKQQYRDLFALLADESNYPFYFHCSWGADRTGSLGILINGVLGVPFEQLVEDYELTSLSNSGTRTRNGWSNGAFMKMINTFIQDYANGGSLQDGITNYLLNYIGVSQAQINSLKSIMLSDASSALTTHTVTYKIDGEIYQQSKVFDGGNIASVVPVYFDRMLDCWLLNGEPFDADTKVTTDLVLEARFKNVIYEDYDVVTIRDLLNIEDTGIPSPGSQTYEGSSATGGRIIEFNYELTCSDEVFDDGVHVEIGAETWACRAHVWFQGLTSIHIFIDGLGPNNKMTPIATYNPHFEYGETYNIKIGVVLPLNGQYAGKKMFVVMINDEILSFIPCQADIASNYSICFAGTEGVMHSVANVKAVTFISYDGESIETKQIVRGQYTSEVEAEEVSGKVFLGWFDELGNVWDFENNRVLKDMKLYARYSDRTIDAMVIDGNGIEIQSGYKVKIGIAVSEIEIPLVSSANLEFDAWYNGNTKLNPTDIITEDMNLICKFKVVEQEQPSENPSVEPISEPISETTSEVKSENQSIEPKSEQPSQPSEETSKQEGGKKKGCKGEAATSLLGLIALAGMIMIQRKRK